MTAGHDVYSQFLDSLLQSEAVRKSSLEQRALAVITTSAALVTLLSGLAAISSHYRSFRILSESGHWFFASSILFVLAAIVGIVVNAPLFYGQIELTKKTLKDAWDDNVSDAQAAVASARLEQLTAARHANTIKAWALLISTVFEVGAVGLLTVAVGYAFLPA